MLACIGPGPIIGIAVTAFILGLLLIGMIRTGSGKDH